MNESVEVEAGRNNFSFGVVTTTPRCSDPEYYNSLYGLIGTLFQVWEILNLVHLSCNIRRAFSWSE